MIRRIWATLRKQRILREFESSQDDYVPETVAEYISEAEHQDGIEYWLYFKNAGEFMKDLDLYIANSEPLS